MDIQLKQRLIGAVVFFTLLIIFVPMFFENGNDKKYIEQVLEPPVVNQLNNDGAARNNNINTDNQQQGIETTDSQVSSSRKLLNNINIDFSDSKSTSKIKHDSRQETISHDDNKLSKNLEQLIKNNNLSKEEVLKHLDVSNITVNENTISSKFDYETKNIYKKVNNKTASTSKTDDKKLAKITKKPISSITANKKNPIKVASEEKSKALPNKLYTLKVQSFDTKEKAQQLNQRLQNVGFPSYIHNERGHYIVYIGPETDKDYLNELLKRLIDETEHTAKVTNHDVNWSVE